MNVAFFIWRDLTFDCSPESFSVDFFEKQRLVVRRPLKALPSLEGVLAICGM
jgi:hypothetical protein